MAVAASPDALAYEPAARAATGSRAWRRFAFNGAALAGMLMLAVVVGAALAAPWVAPHDPAKQSLLRRFTPPVWQAGGNAAYLNADDGNTYYYAHFSRYEGKPRKVLAGDVIGYVGMTGVTTGPHLHFEIHPDGGEPVDPYALLLGLCVDEMALPKPKKG